MQDFIRYLPHTEEDIRKMLDVAGVKKLEDLFQTIPKEVRLSKPLKLPEPLSEPELLHHFQRLQGPPLMNSFLGAGAYQHFIPAVVSSLTSRSEFYTAYTFYQPEISQGTLQAIFEYQTLQM